MRWCDLLLLLAFVFLNGCASLQGAKLEDGFFPSKPLAPGIFQSIFDDQEIPVVSQQEEATPQETKEPPKDTGLMDDVQPVLTGEKLPDYSISIDYPSEAVLSKMDDATLSNYRLDAGDLISIKVFGEGDFSVETRLSGSGTVSYPFLGELQLAGLSASEVEERITTGLDGDYLIDPKVTVTILEHRKFFVNGEVEEPGGYAYIPGLTVNKAISLAGGFTEQALREKLFVIREGSKTPQPITLGEYISPGDILLITESFFFVNGEVQKPGRYTYAKDLTVNKAISLAGGFSERADRRKIYIIHEGHEKATLVSLGTHIQPGDILIIKDSFF